MSECKDQCDVFAKPLCDVCQEKMQKVVEAAGECWHEHDNFREEDNISIRCPRCPKCKKKAPYCNPSTSDLNELFRLAEKMKLDVELGLDKYGRAEASIYKNSRSLYAGECSPGEVYTPAEALLNALHESIKAEQALAKGGK